MSTLAQDSPLRAIRNAIERLERVSKDTPLEGNVSEDVAIIRTALEQLAPVGSSRTAWEPHVMVTLGYESFEHEFTRELLWRPIRKRCETCSHCYDPSERVCPRCDLFASGG